jgi:hypothetical protein
MPSLNSSCLSWADYNSGTLRLAFRSGRTYTLHGVPEYHYYGLLSASSPGWYFNAYLKGRY